MNELTEEVRGLQKQLADGDQSEVVESLQAEVSQLRSTMNDLSQGKIHGEEQLKMKEEEIDRLTNDGESQRQALEGEISLGKKRIVELEKEIKEWENRLEEARQEDEGFTVAIEKV